jgi:signal transduction histidine kinase
MIGGVASIIPFSDEDRRVLRGVVRRLEPYMEQISHAWYEKFAESQKIKELPGNQVKELISTWLSGIESIKEGGIQEFLDGVSELGGKLIREGTDYQSILMSLHLYEETTTPLLLTLYSDAEELREVLTVLDKLYHSAIAVLASSYFNVKDEGLREYSEKLEKKVEERTRELGKKITVLTGLHDISDMLREEIEAERIYGDITERIACLMNVEKCCIILYDKEKMQFNAAFPAYGMREEQLKDLSFSLEDAAHTFEYWIGREPLVSNDPGKDDRLIKKLAERFGESNLLLAKLLMAGEFLGILRLANKRGGDFTRDDARLAEIIASRLGAALHTTILITKLRESEEHLFNLKNFNQEIVEKLPLGIFRLDRDMCLIYENPAARQIMQVPEKEESMALGIDIRKLPSVIDAGISRELDDLLAGKEVHLEMSFKSLYGRNAHLRMRGVPLLRKGRFEGAILMVEDVTERKKAEDIMRNIAQGISATTGEKFFRSLVQHLAKALGVDYAFVGELKGRGNIVETVAVSSLGRIVENFMYSLKGTPCSEVIRDGFCYYPRGVQQQFIEDSLLVKMKVESYMGMTLGDSASHPLGLMVAMDRREMKNPKLAESMLRIFAVRAAAELERKQAEERIRELSRFPERNPNPVFKILKNGDIAYYNPAVFKYVDESWGVNKLLPAGYVELANRLLSTGKEARIEHKIGDHIIEYLIWPVSKEAIHAYGRDITQRKIAEKKLRSAYNDLKSIDELKSNIVANVSHELRTPITIAMGALELLKQEKDPEKRRALVTMAGDALIRQNMIVGDLIDAAAIDKSEFQLKREPFNLSNVIHIAIGDYTAVAQKKDIKIVLRISKDLPPVLADNRKIWHVLNNLLSNAIKFTEGRGRVTVDATRRGEMVEVCVIDTGIGIPHELKNKIFDRFYQIDSSGTRRFGGTGLGLAIVREIIKAHGGDIRVESEVGKGSKFCFTLPVA